jgi:hypothetical protein
MFLAAAVSSQQSRTQKGRRKAGLSRFVARSEDQYFGMTGPPQR